MDMRLYDYIKEIDEIMVKAVDEDGVIIDEELMAKLDELELGKSEKVDNCIKFFKSRKAMAEALKNEKMAIAKRQQTAENEAESIKEYLAYCLAGSKWESVAGKISYRNSKAVEIDDIDAIPENFTTMEIKADKTAIKKAIENGEEVAGAHIEERTSTIIK